MSTTPLPPDQGQRPLADWLTVFLLLAAATLSGALLDPYVSLTSQAMLYVLVIVIAAYRLDWVPSAVCAIGAVTALNFFFVPPRFTFEVESREHLIALVVMLAVALVISHLAAGLRRESRHATLSEQRARQLQALATELANTTAPDEIMALGQRALDAAFAGPNSVTLTQDVPPQSGPADGPDSVRDGLRCCMTECAVLGPGTGRWPGLNAWYLPLGDKGHVMGAACVQPALASDTDGREHAQALCALLAQTVWRVRLAATVQAAQIEAQRQQLQSTFLAAVSHDLRTPLAAIVGAASSLQTQHDKLSATEQERLLGSIASEATYLSTLTENTLQLVRLTSLQQALRKDWESLEEVVGTVLARVRQRDPGRRIKSKVPLGLPLIKADPVLLAQLISNLLDNALQYSDGEIELNVSATAHTLVIAIKDRGPGIAEAEQDLIFEPYQRGDQSGARGAGLGLALCRAIAVAHGGSLTVKRRNGGGSSFVTTLPLDEQPTEQELT
ncbi:MAG: ATP-binding protein [Rhodoferax sp.]|uniref:ATP-binding protein n=1 Tax=Rhodoferax sp. TaxID=50421 RepID=UPI003016B83A